VCTKTFSFPANRRAKWKHKDLAFQQVRKPDGSTNLLKELLFTYLFTNMLPINDEYYFGMIANAATSEK
jgi:hypothetical protein